MPHDDCKIADKLVQIHEWTHKALGALNKKELKEAHALGNEILDLLNEKEVRNGIKFLALFETLALGADVMKEEAAILGGDVTIQ